MKCFLFIIFLWTVYSCADTKNADNETPVVIKKLLPALSDSFNTRDLMSEPSLQYDIPLDTINIFQNENLEELTIIFPKLSPLENSFLYKRINDIVRKSKNDFLKEAKNDEIEYDSVSQEIGFNETIEPKSLYKTEKVASFSFQTYYLSIGSSFKYDVINYDLEKNKLILLNDYFLLKTSADSIYLSNIVSRAIKNKFSKEYLGALNFSFDDQYVYFYFDKYNIFSWGVSSVKKKYILDHINLEYR